MSKTITISNELEKKIVAFCDDELNYHIHDSGCADEYEGEIIAQIELLRLLGYKEIADEYESDFIDEIKELSGNCDDDWEYVEDTEDDPFCKAVSPDELEDSKIDIREEFSSYDSGHCAYMVCGIVNEDAFEDYLARINLKLEPIGGYKFDKETGTAWFDTCEDTCEKYGPELTGAISEKFPEATVYGTDQWESSYVKAYSEGGMNTPLMSVADFELDKCFEDCGNLRIDVTVIDKATGSKINIGDTVYLYNLIDVENIEEDPTYSYLISLIGYDSRIDEAVEECRRYHEKEEERG